MTWSKRNRIQLVVAVAVGLTSVVCIGAAIGAWKATSNKQSVTANTSSLDVPTVSPTGTPTQDPNPTPLPQTSPPQLPPPTRSPTALPALTPTTPLPSNLPTPVPTHLPTSQPVPLPTKPPTRAPTRFPTRAPTRAPTLSPTASPTKAYDRVELDSPSAASSECPPDQALTTFYAIADTPYNQVEANELPIQVRSLPSDAEFLVHLGDIRSAKNGGSCKLYEYNNVAAILRQSPVPVFMVIGGKSD